MNLPNKLSILRIVMVPLFVVMYFLAFTWSPYVALAIFILAALTDMLDGYIARKYNLVTDLGKLLDPIADKILVCAALFCIAVTNPLRLGIGGTAVSVGNSASLLSGHVFLAVSGTLVLSRELLIDAVRQVAASKGKVVQANIYGKIKTVLLDVSIPFFMTAEGLARKLESLSIIRSADLENLQTAYNVISWSATILFALAIVMTVASGVVYIVQNRKVFAQND